MLISPVAVPNIQAPSSSPPADPSQNPLWWSTRIRDGVVDPSPGSRKRLWQGQESTPILDVAGGKIHCFYTGSQSGMAHRWCAIGADIENPANWSAGVECVGPNAAYAGGRTASTVAHGGVSQFGTTLYYYFAYPGSPNTVGVATADITAPETWTVVSTNILSDPQSHGLGNIHVVLDGSTYRMFFEYLIQGDHPGLWGGTQTWQSGMATSSTPTGAFTVQIADLQSPWVNNATDPPLNLPANQYVGSSLSHPRIYAEAGGWTMVYHAGENAVLLPNYIFVATAPSLASDDWTPAHNGEPIMVAAGRYEYDQVCDAAILQLPGGTNYIFYSANRNQSSNPSGLNSMNVCITRLMPGPMMYDGCGSWKPAAPSFYGMTHALSSRFLDMPMQFHVLGSDVPMAKSGSWTVDVAGRSVSNGSGADGDWIEWQGVFPPGVYNVGFDLGIGPGYGKLACWVDNVMEQNGFTVIGSGTYAYDCYAASPDVVHYATTFTVNGRRAMRRRIRLYVSGKNGSSSGYALKIYGVSFNTTG